MSRFMSLFKSAWNISRDRNQDPKFRFRQLKLVTPYLRGHRLRLVTGALLMVVVSLVNLPVPYLMKVLIDDVFPRKDFSLLHILTLIILGLYASKFVLSFMMSYLFSILNQDIQLNIRKDLFHRLLRLPLSFYSNQQSGYLMARLHEAQGINAFFSASLVGLAVSIIEFILTMAVLFHLNWELTCIALLVLPFYFIIVRLTSHGLRTSSRDFMEKGAQLSKSVQESFSGINVIKTFRGEERETGKIQKSLAGYFRTGVLQSILLSLSTESIFLVGALGTTAILWYSGIEIMHGQFTIGAYVAFAGYLTRLYIPTHRFASVGIILQPAIVALSRISEFFTAVAEDSTRRTIGVPRLKGDIRFENVSFAYEENNEVLSGVDLHILPGMKLALIGPSGGGKTTLVSLILQLYTPSRGTIYLDGTDASAIRLQDIREKIGIVSQDVFLFNDTIGNNIRYGRPDASEEEVQAVSKLVYAHDFIEELPAGYDTLVGERGVRLSAGQRQRISIARAILYDPDVLIFDEATASLDALSEKVVREFIFGRSKSKTIIMIAHKFSTISSADQVIVLENGVIKQQGDPEALSRCEGLYKKLYDAQNAAAS